MLCEYSLIILKVFNKVVYKTINRLSWMCIKLLALPFDTNENDSYNIYAKLLFRFLKSYQAKQCGRVRQSESQSEF